MSPALQKILLILFFSGVIYYIFFSNNDVITDTPRPEVSCKTFTVFINGKHITKDARIHPDFPIIAYFCHPNPNVHWVRMQHPGDSNLYQDFKVSQQHRIANHEQHMRAGHDSTSVLSAWDSVKKEHTERIFITFEP
mgnify:CR=1 FL=1